MSAKDIILALIARIGVGGGTGHVFEYRGEAIRALTMEQRMTICNMSIEGGARAGLIAPDDTTFEYVHGRPHAPAGAEWDAAVARWRQLPTDDGATFDKSITIDANALEPMITYGTNPGMGIPITSRVPSPADETDPAARRALEHALSYMDLQPGQPILGQKVDVVFVGSCTNGRISDLRLAAAALKDRRVADGVQLMVTPGSDEVKREAEREGLADIFKAAGADWRESGCSMCIAMNGDQLSPGQYAVSTSNRNFEGRQGKGGRTFLASPLTAAASAVNGRRHRPEDAARHRVTCRGRGALTMARADRRLHEQGHPDRQGERRYRPDRPGALSEGDRQGRASPTHCSATGASRRTARSRNRRSSSIDPGMAGRSILLVGDNFGAGSSREHAPWALTSWGVRAILSTGFADIFRSNSLKNGLLPIVVPADVHARLRDLIERDPDADLTVDLSEQGVLLPDGSTVEFDIDPFAKRMLLAGTDELGYLLSKEPAIARLGGGPPAEDRDAHERLNGSHGSSDGRRHQSRPRRDMATPALSDGLRALGGHLWLLPYALRQRRTGLARDRRLSPVRDAQSARSIGPGDPNRSADPELRGARRGRAAGAAQRGLIGRITVQRAQTAQPRYGVGPCCRWASTAARRTRNGRVAACGAGRFIGSDLRCR